MVRRESEVRGTLSNIRSQCCRQMASNRQLKVEAGVRWGEWHWGIERSGERQ